MWTWPGRDHSLTSGKIDYARSAYYNDDGLAGVKAAYRDLWALLGADQIVWCWTKRDEYRIREAETCEEWEIEVPSEGILAIVDTYVWNALLGFRPLPPASIVDEGCRRVRETGDPAQAEAAYKEYWDNLMMCSREKLLSRLLMDDARAEGATPLLSHPVPEEWVVARRTATEARQARGRKGR